MTKSDSYSLHTVTRADLAEKLLRRVGLSRTESGHLVESFIAELTDAAARGEDVKIYGFGTFQLRKKPPRVGRNPKTGVEAPITARRVMVFKPSAALKARVKAGLGAGGGGRWKKT